MNASLLGAAFGRQRVDEERAEQLIHDAEQFLEEVGGLRRRCRSLCPVGVVVRPG